jgi:hypothetical protein
MNSAKTTSLSPTLNEKEAIGPPKSLHLDDKIEDVEGQQVIQPGKTSIFKGLGLLDQLLALWIFLAMVIGVLLGNFVPSTGPALQKGKFVGVSIPIGQSSMSYIIILMSGSCRIACYDVSHPLQDQIRNLECCTSQA